MLSDIDFTLNQGVHMAVLGESGCGKSTLLHLIYGLLHLDKGEISYNGNRLLGPTHNLVPGEPFIKLVSQDLSLMPFSTVTENVSSFLNRQDPKKETSRVNALLDLVALSGYKNTLIKNLSGGQKQRVAIAKALANKPELLLLDEPFSDIDTFRKNKLRRSLFQYLKANNISCIMATHDPEEALAFSDTLMILHQGKIETIDTPQKVFNNPKSIHQASFFGEVTTLPSGMFTSEKFLNKTIFLPHQLALSEEKTNLQVTIEKCFYKGTHYLIQAVFKDKEVFFNHHAPITEETVALKAI